MIVVQLLGGLGNQLFQYAIGRRLSLERNVPLKLDVSALARDLLRTYKLSFFNITETIATSTDVWRMGGLGLRPHLLRAIETRLLNGNKWLHRQPVFSDNLGADDLSQIGTRAYLEGYWQGESYLKPIESMLRTELVVKAPPNLKNHEMASCIMDTESVSLHIRRGDYATDPKTRALHGLLPLTYYHAAVRKIAQSTTHPHFFVFSDDPVWAKTNLMLDYPTTFIDHNGPDQDYEDLRLLSLCKQHIIANSTFSWWGAWLSPYPDKVVYSPARWFVNGSMGQHIGLVNWYRLEHEQT